MRGCSPGSHLHWMVTPRCPPATPAWPKEWLSSAGRGSRRWKRNWPSSSSSDFPPKSKVRMDGPRLHVAKLWLGAGVAVWSGGWMAEVDTALLEHESGGSVEHRRA